MGKENPMESALDGIASIYNEAKNQAKSMSGEKLPEGKYEMSLSNIKLKVKKQETGAPKISLMRFWTVLSGEYAGMTQVDFMALSNEVGLAFAMKDIAALGYDVPESAHEWPELVESLQEDIPEIIGEVSHSGDFVNISIVELLDDPEVDEEEMREDLKELSRKEMKKINKAEGLGIRVVKSMSDEDLVEEIIEARLEDEDE